MDAVFKTDEGVFNYRIAGVWLHEDHVLLHRDANDNRWALPGGRVKIMEASSVAVEREFLEELGIQVKVDQFLWSTENFFEYDGRKMHEVGFYYLVSPNTDYKFSHEPFFGVEGERLIYQWFPIAELEGVSLYPEFLVEGLKGIPTQDEHKVINDLTAE